MAEVQGKGPLGTGANQPFIEVGSVSRGRSPCAGSSCISRDPSMLDKTGYVLDAWAMAQDRYAGKAIIKHTQEDFYELIKGIVPAMMMALGAVFVSTLLGAAVGSLFGGVGAIPGAAIGAALGMFFLNWLGLGALAIFVAERTADIGLQMYVGIEIAWNSRGSGAKEIAAREMAEAVGLFYSALLQGIVMYLSAAMAESQGPKALQYLRESRLFQRCAGLENWIRFNYTRLCWRYKIKSQIKVYTSKIAVASDASILLQLSRGPLPKGVTAQSPGTYVPESGITRAHFEAFQQEARNGNVIGVRNTNLKSTPLIERGFPGKTKKLEALKTSEETGIVTAKNPTQEKIAREAGYWVADENGMPRDLAGNARSVGIPEWPIQPGQVIDPETKLPFVGDYDLLCVFKPESPTANIVYHSQGGTKLPNQTNPLIQRLSEVLNLKFDRPRVLHGSQEGYGGLPGSGGSTIFLPDGSTLLLKDPQAVEWFYEALGRQPITGQY